MKNLKVSDFMTGKSIFFEKSMTIQNAVTKLLNSKEIGGPVIDEKKHVVGWLSEQDCLGKMIEASYYCQLAALVEDVMVHTPLFVSQDMSIVDLASQMRLSKPKIYPVVDEDNKYVGLISRKDVLRGISHFIENCQPVA